MKPFDLKDLAARLSASVGPLSEEAAKAATKDIFAWLTESCEADGSLVLKFLPPALAVVEPMILKIEDSIDGQ